MDRSKWEYKKLGEVCAPKSDILRANKLFGNDDIIDYVDISSIDNTTHCITQPTSYVFKEAPSRAQQKVEQGDILYSLVRPNLKNVAVVTSQDTEKYVASSGFCVLRGKEIETRYLYHMVLGNTFTNYILGLVSGANYPAVREDDVKGFTFRCPPITDQQRIVAELDCLNEMIALKQEQLKEFDKLAQSIFYDMFGDPVLNEKRWEIRPLGELISIMGGFAFKSSSYVDIGIRLVQIANVWEDNIKWDEITHVPKEDVNKRPDYLLKPGDIVMALTRPIIKSLGSVKIARIRNCDIPCALNQRVCKFAFSNSLLSPHWFYHFARTDYFKDMINSFSSKGMQPNVSTKEIESILTPYIPLSLQQQFAEKISAIEAQKELVKQSIAEMQALLDYTMDKYFG